MNGPPVLDGIGTGDSQNLSIIADPSKRVSIKHAQRIAAV